ncbi:mitochondrial ATPase expression-domain-containing protein [Xylaria palmicola]|nr:mitochondrial ATPase expression-domain-containing protein [Xylaria palmicola]
MQTAISVAKSGGRGLLRRAPRGTRRSCHHYHHHHTTSRSPIAYGPPRSALHGIDCPPRHHGYSNGVPGLRYATTHSLPVLSDAAVAHVQALLTPSDTSTFRGTGSVDNSITPIHTNATESANPFAGALEAMRHGDTRRLLLRLRAVQHLVPDELQHAVATIPRTTFTEFFRALDPLRAAKDCDPIGESYTSVGMAKQLNMDSSIDDWGVRRLYTELLQHLLFLTGTLKIAGYTLHPEEYIVLLRCTAACSDITGTANVWHDISSSPTLAWRNTELSTEFIKARFLTEPLYTQYHKLTRMVTPRNLHRSRLTLSNFAVRRLDALRIRVRARKARFGLNKDVDYTEDLMRILRGVGPAQRLFKRIMGDPSYHLDEDTICALMIALGRSGAMRFTGQILQRYFGITTPHSVPLQPLGEWAQAIRSTSPPQFTPTVRLMRAVVETYGSNAEIGVALQLVEYLSSRYKIRIPPDVWQDILEWTYIMTTPPTSTAWEMAKLYQKIPVPDAVEVMFDAMTSPPRNQVPTFKHYDILIRSLLGREDVDLSLVFSRMREAITLYDKQCVEYEEAVFQYTKHLRDRIAHSSVVHRFERARFGKQMMWYDVSVWCRSLLKRHAIRMDGSIPGLPSVHDFVDEFRSFLRNPVEYDTPTGRVAMTHPGIETFRGIRIEAAVEQLVPIRNVHHEWEVKQIQAPRWAVLSSHSLAGFKPDALGDPVNPANLLAPRNDMFYVPPKSAPKDGSHVPAKMPTEDLFYAPARGVPKEVW